MNDTRVSIETYLQLSLYHQHGLALCFRKESNKTVYGGQRLFLHERIRKDGEGDYLEAVELDK